MSPLAASAVAPARPVVANVSRDRMKREMRELRETVVKLERELNELKRAQTQRQVMQQPNTLHASKVQAVWESMARGQYELRHRSEMENYKLRKTLDEQRKVTETLERLFSRQIPPEIILGAPLTKKRARSDSESASSCPLDHPTVIGDLRSSLPGLYDQAETVFSSEAFTTRADAFRDIDLRHSGSVDVYLEAREKRLLPFRLQDTSNAVWAYFINYQGSVKRNVEEEVVSPSCTMDRSFKVDVKLARFAGQTRVKVAARRHAEAHRAVFVWVAFFDPSEMLPPQVNGLIVKQTGWIAVRSVPAESALTELLTAQVSVPEYYEVASLRKRRSNTVSSYLIGSITSQLDVANEVIDNLLMEWALTRREL